MTTYKRIHTHVLPGQLLALQKLSEKSGAPVALLIRRAIDKYLKTVKP